MEKEKFSQLLGLALVSFYGGFIVWLYLANPSNLEELTRKARLTVEQASTGAKILTNTYEADEENFQKGLQAFRNENFVLAREFFDRADPAKRSAKVQFYIAYSFYRQGWGKISNDDRLFKKGLETAELVIKLDSSFHTDDPDLKLKTPFELKQELEDGLKITASDFNPLKFFRERK
ncbi:MAG: hypothetical protein RML33_09080 [Acidobacteriota bacterium]|nr:hypothetical protein [Pyrinomonadaceae bacterium]MDW8304970.1 hypothetical protein [Acidobacteriota bacterium]